MILVVAATDFEMQPLTRLLAVDKDGSGQEVRDNPYRTLIAGVGPVETALRLTRYLERSDTPIDMVLNFGVAGAYVSTSSGASDQAALLDLCLAEQESLGDFGICFAEAIEAFDPKLGGDITFPLDPFLLVQARNILARQGMAYRCGNFVTVSAASATRKRGMMLAARFHGLCENMEGAAVARVCAEFSLPLLEVRVISNMVEDRDVTLWRMAEACSLAAEATALLVRKMGER